jgi:hypothetical protein
MLLKFFGRNAHTVYWPGTYAPGQARPQPGKTFIPAEGRDKPARYVLDKEPAEVDSDKDPEAAAHFARQCKKGGLLAADKETAAHCGVEFVQVAQGADGDWSPVPARAPQKKAEAS